MTVCEKTFLLQDNAILWKKTWRKLPQSGTCHMYVKRTIALLLKYHHTCNCPDLHLGPVSVLSQVSPLLYFSNAQNCLDRTSKVIMLFRGMKYTEKYRKICVKRALLVLLSYCCLDNNDNWPEASANREPQPLACWNSPVVPAEVLTDERGDEEVQFWGVVHHRLRSAPHTRISTESVLCKCEPDVKLLWDTDIIMARAGRQGWGERCEGGIT